MKMESVKNSSCVNVSNGVNRSAGVSGSSGVNRSYGVNSSAGLNRSYGVSLSDGVNRSSGVNRSFGVNSSFGVLNSEGVTDSIFVVNRRMKPKIFKTEVTKERFEEVNSEIYKKIGSWRPTFNNIKSLYFKNGSDWTKTPIENAKEISKEEAWKDMPKEAIAYIKSLPEFDAEIFKEITGLEV